ncbi:bi-domain-containing oxidoreductase [Candidatus Poribacteria bacterium]|nr:bi-domain-containing oxidoreductase [Candidatus Poribacteria bacterium]
MKQLVQNFKTGELLLEEIPPPMLQAGRLLVQNAYSLISAGTERSTVSTGQASLLSKAKQRPDLVKQVVESVQREGIVATYKKVRARLETLKPLGYSSAGIVLGSDGEAFQPGDRVACGGYAHHAELIAVPKNLCVKVPDGVALDEAAFTMLGAIAMQGVRQAQVQVGERGVVVGLGLVGLLTVSILKAAGCKVLGVDISASHFPIAQELGCDAVCMTSELVGRASDFTRGNGADAILLTAATQSNEPIALAGEVARKKAKIVVVGVVGLNVPRDPHYYRKELDIRFSCSYGPGRYDPEYEEQGHDYPVGYVRWTENRNMEAFLDLLAEGKIKLRSLITHVFPIEKALDAYNLILGKRNEPYIGVLLKYDEQKHLEDSPRLLSTGAPPKTGKVSVGLIGAGSFAQNYLIPGLKAGKGVALKAVCTATGISAKSVADKFGFEHFTTDIEDIFNDDEINTVFIATRHHLHTPYVLKALETGKHVYVEKPLCISETELEALVELYQRKSDEVAPPLVMVGFNRRFAPMTLELKAFLRDVNEPLILTYRVNAGFIPSEHWVHDSQEGGGRIIGEVCHFVDIIQYLAGSPITSVYARALPNNGRYHNDNVAITLNLENASVGTVIYLANADKGLPKEKIEAFGGGRAGVIEDSREIALFRNGTKRRWKRTQDKGHKAEIQAFLQAVEQGKPSPVPLDEAVNTTSAIFKILKSLEIGKPIDEQPLDASREEETSGSFQSTGSLA